MIVAIIFSLLSSSLVWGSEKGSLVCLSKLGCVEGTLMPGFQTEQFEAFMGIPFAEPPIGPLRFKNPEPITPWNTTLTALTPRGPCIQRMYFIDSWPIVGSEDCLYLNLYRPTRRNENLLPVVFYIHGGGFFALSPSPDLVGPEYFMDSGEVIFVAAAYRLGPFGFLSTGDESAPGNFGFKDQNMALKWVQHNILAFGGDPGSVTIVGHSAGACSVHYHMMSSASKGLFHRAATISGSAFGLFGSILEDPYSQALQIANSAGITNADDLTKIELVEALRSRDAEVILRAGDSLKLWNILPITNFRPVLEDKMWSNAFLTERPEDAMQRGNFARVPWIMGLVPNKGEGVVIALRVVETESLRQEFNANFDALLQQLLEFPSGVPKDVVDKMMAAVIREFFNDKRQLNNETLDAFLTLFGDIHFVYPLYRTMKLGLRHIETDKNPFYLYFFDYRGSHSYSTVFSGGSERDIGTAHYDDSMYFMRAPLFMPDSQKDSVEADLIARYVEFYVDFAKNGKLVTFDKLPTCTAEAFSGGGESGICEHLNFLNDGQGGFTETISREFEVRRMKFWENFWKALSEYQ